MAKAVEALALMAGHFEEINHLLVRRAAEIGADSDQSRKQKRLRGFAKELNPLVGKLSGIARAIEENRRAMVDACRVTFTEAMIQKSRDVLWMVHERRKCCSSCQVFPVRFSQLRRAEM